MYLHNIKNQFHWISFYHQPVLPTNDSKLFSFVTIHFFMKYLSFEDRITGVSSILLLVNDKHLGRNTISYGFTG